MLMKKTVITQIQGIAVGFGVLMMVASDLRIFADRPKEELYIRLPELIISAFPQTGATLMPLLAFGFSNAKKFLFTGDNIGLEELKNIKAGKPVLFWQEDNFEGATAEEALTLLDETPRGMFVKDEDLFFNIN